MSDKKISELTEETNLLGVKAIGIKESGNVSFPCKFDIGNISNLIESSVNGIINPTKVDTFSLNRNYYAGEIVIYTNQGEVTPKIYKFTKTHWNNTPWNGTEGVNADVIETTLWEEIQSVASSAYETVQCTVSFVDASDNNISSETIEGRAITVRYDNGDESQTFYTNSSGICTFNVNKGVGYVVTSSDILGYTKPIEKEFVASIEKRYVNIIYRVGSFASCSITATYQITDGTASDYNGKTVTLVPESGTGTIQTQNLTYDGTSDAYCVFGNVPQGTYVTLQSPTVVSYVRPNDKKFIVSGTNINVLLKTTTTNQSGIFYVDGADYREYIIDHFPSGHTCVALHIATEELLSRGFDYYVRIADLTTSRTLQTQMWSTKTNMLLPHVTTSYSNTVLRDYDGPTMTYYMIQDTIKLNSDTSPAALYANRLTYTHNGVVYNGYIGTRMQWQPLFDNSTTIYQALSDFGYTGNFKTGTNWWSSTQYSANFAWGWDSGGYWDYTRKTGSNYVLPFFAIR